MSFQHVLFRLKRSVSVPLVFLKGTCGVSNFTSYSRILGDKTCSHQCNVVLSDVRKAHNFAQWGVMFVGLTGTIIGMNLSPASCKDAPVEDSGSETSSGNALIAGLQRVEDGSIVSNKHTVKWRIFTDNGRDLFLKGNLGEAEKYFILASEEAKVGFGERDPHVASSLNNLAELYRVQKAFDKAEPLYLEAIDILEEAFGPEDVRVGVALHNLGQFYLVQKKLDEAQRCYEKALKIKGRVLGFEHMEYAETMYHLGKVMYLEGKEKDGEALIQNSLRILEDGGLGQSAIFVKRMRYLSQILLKSGLLHDAEALQRKILHLLEISKGWTLETVIAAEQLALTLQSCGDLQEAQELMERCLHTRKNILPEEHVQVASSMLHLARIKMLKSSELKKSNISVARAALSDANFYLEDSIRIARTILDRSKATGQNSLNARAPVDSKKDSFMALITMLQSLSAIGLLEVSKYELQNETVSRLSLLKSLADDKNWKMMQMTGHPGTESEHALRECIALYKEREIRSLLKYPDVKEEYLSCLRHLMSVLEDYYNEESQLKGTLRRLKDDVKHIENDILDTRNKARS